MSDGFVASPNFAPLFAPPLIFALRNIDRALVVVIMAQ